VNIGGSFFDVFVTLDPANLANDTGTLTITSNGTGGGAFNSFFDVFTEITLHPVGGGPDIMQTGPSFQLSGTGDWSNTPPPNYPTDPSLPSGGFFLVGPVQESSPTGSEVHVVSTAQTPEPGEIVGLIGIGMVGFFAAVRRHQASKAFQVATTCN
jgi:hypothetical protein